MDGLNTLEKLFILNALCFNLALLIHFGTRKWHFDWAMRYGWIIYALSIPSALLSMLLLLNHEQWFYWVGGLIYLVWAAFGYYVEYIKRIEWRFALRWSILVPYVSLYLGTVMFYWWPLARIYKPLWYIFAALFVVNTILNVASHKTPAVSKKLFTALQVKQGETK
jgi:hypothetical protein